MARYDADDVYCIPGTAVLKNKAGITNQDLRRYCHLQSLLLTLCSPENRFYYTFIARSEDS